MNASESDRATFAQLRKRVTLEIVFAGGGQLLNTYAVIIDSKGERRADSQRFAEWLESGEGRTLIEGFRIAGSEVPPFTVWPAQAPRDVPGARPGDTR